MVKRAQSYPVVQLTGGLNVNVDATFLVDRESPNLRNIRLEEGLIKKGLGFRQFGVSGANGLPLDGTPMLIDTFPMQSGTIHHLFATNKWVYRYLPLSRTYEKKNTTQFTGDEDNRFSSAVTLSSAGTDLYILTNGKDRIQKWDGSGGNFTNLGGWSTGPILARQLAIFQSRLVAGFTIEGGQICPWRVRWSVAGNPENITGTGSGFVDLAETPDWIVALALLKGKLYAFKERSIWELAYVGGTDVFKPVIRINNVGTYSPHSVVSLGEEIIFYGTDNVYIYDGLDITPIGKNIYPYLYTTDKKLVNSAKGIRVTSGYIEELKEFVMCCPTTGDVPNLLFTYNFDYQAWTLRDIEITAIGYYTVPSGYPWSDLVGNWSSQQWVWMEKNLPSGAPTTLIGTPNGYIYEDDRLTKSTDYMGFETKDWVFGHAQRWTELRILAKGGPFQVSYSLDRGLTWSNPKTFTRSDEFIEHVLHINETSQQIRAKIESIAEELTIKWIEPWYIPKLRSVVTK